MEEEEKKKQNNFDEDLIDEKPFIGLPYSKTTRVRSGKSNFNF